MSQADSHLNWTVCLPCCNTSLNTMHLLQLCPLLSPQHHTWTDPPPPRELTVVSPRHLYPCSSHSVTLRIFTSRSWSGGLGGGLREGGGATGHWKAALGILVVETAVGRVYFVLLKEHPCTCSCSSCCVAERLGGCVTRGSCTRHTAPKAKMKHTPAWMVAVNADALSSPNFHP